MSAPTIPTHVEPEPSIGQGGDLDDGVLAVTPEEGRRLFDQAARAWMGIDGEEFIRRWEAGEYWEIADQPGNFHIGDLIGLIPFARQDS